MAEQILYGIVENLITKAGSSAFQEIKLVYDFKNELDEFLDSLSTIRAVLLDAEEKQEKSHAVQNWLKRLRKIMYNADDLLDDLAYEDLRRKIAKKNVARQVGDFFSSSNRMLIRYRMGHRIHDLSMRLNDVKNDISVLSLVRREIVAGVQNKISQRETDSYVEKLAIVGREEDKQFLVESFLCASNEGNVSLRAIVGLGGLGKTTLAQLVYNDENVSQHFEKRMWVCVSDEFDVKFLLKKILKCVTSDEVDKLEMEQMQIKLRENLEGKRYLLVLDDVWNENWHQWHTLRKYMLLGAPGSRILVTTRKKTVAMVMGDESPYELQGLNETQSWNLFEKLALGERRGVVNPNLIEIGRQIVKKCKGVPLAIRTLGSLMWSKSREDEWLSMLRNDLWRLCDSREDIIPVLKLSYDHFPIPLRRCFAYCGMFPKDYEFEKEQLIYLWMAQDYIVASSNNDRLEDIGEQYFNALQFSSFFQLFKEYGRKYYKMHDLIHDLAQTIWKGGDGINIVGEGFQHVHCGYEADATNGLVNAKDIRTLLAGNNFCPFIMKDENDIFLVDKLDRHTKIFRSNYQRIRALQCVISQFPSRLGKLKHLRYLEISIIGLQTLPNSITNLHNLKTLIVLGLWELKNLPKDMKNLISLRHFLNYGCISLKPVGLGQLTALQRLPLFMAGNKGSCTYLNELEHLNQLGGDLLIERLGFIRNFELDSIKPNLWKKERLRFLTLNWLGSNNLFRWSSNDIVTSRSSREESEVLLEKLQPHSNLQQLHVREYNGQSFSSWLLAITNLQEIRLEKCGNLKKIPALDKLPSLKTLHFIELHALEYISNEEDDEVGESTSISPSASTSTPTQFFPALEEIKIRECFSLKGLWIRSTKRNGVGLCQFPRLLRLHIHGCLKLESLPNGISQATSLQVLRVGGCPKVFERCTKEIGVDWPNISHIPNIVMNDFDGDN